MAPLGAPTRGSCRTLMITGVPMKLPGFATASPLHFPTTMLNRGTRAHLYLNDKDVAAIVVNRFDNSWTFGEFTPSPAFGEFAPLFGQWSLLMHADGDAEPLSEAAADELREAENALTRIRAKIFLPDSNEWCSPAEVNIDGTLIEWKEA